MGYKYDDESRKILEKYGVDENGYSGESRQILSKYGLSETKQADPYKYDRESQSILLKYGIDPGMQAFKKTGTTVVKPGVKTSTQQQKTPYTGKVAGSGMRTAKRAEYQAKGKLQEAASDLSGFYNEMLNGTKANELNWLKQQQAGTGTKTWGDVLGSLGGSNLSMDDQIAYIYKYAPQLQENYGRVGTYDKPDQNLRDNSAYWSMQGGSQSTDEDIFQKYAVNLDKANDKRNLSRFAGRPEAALNADYNILMRGRGNPEPIRLSDGTIVSPVEQEAYIAEFEGLLDIQSQTKPKAQESAFLKGAQKQTAAAEDYQTWPEWKKQGFENESQANAYERVTQGVMTTLANGGTANDYYNEVKAEYEPAYARYQQLQNEVQVKRANYASRAAAMTPEEKAELDALEQQLAQQAHTLQFLEYHMDFAEQYRYMDLPSRPEHASNVDKGREKWAAVEQQVQTNRDQRVTEANLGNVESAGFNEAGEDWYTFRTPIDGHMTPEQEEIWYDLYGSGREQEAYDYAATCARANLAAKEQAWKQGEMEKGGENALTRTGAFLGSLATFPTAAWDYMGMLQQWANTGYIMPQQPNGHTPRQFTQAWSEGAAAALNEQYGTLPDSWGFLSDKGIGDAYLLAESILQSYSVAGLGGGAVNALFFFGAAADGTQKALENGAPEGKALAYGAVCGAAEVLGETWSVENLLDMDKSVPFLINMLKQSGVEASEEGFTDLLVAFGDELVNRDKSELNLKIQANMAAGMDYDTASRKAWTEFTNEVLADMAGGFLSGGGSTILHYTAGTAAHNVAASMQKYTGDYQGLIDTAKVAGTSDVDAYVSKAMAEYEKNAANDKKGKGWISQRTAEKVYDAATKSMDRTDRSTLTQATKERLSKYMSWNGVFRMTDEQLTARAEKIVDAALDGKEHSFSTGYEQNAYDELVTQLEGSKVETGNWLDTSSLKTTQARQVALERTAELAVSTVKVDGEVAQVKQAVMEDGKLKLEVEQNGETKVLGLDQIELTKYQQGALDTLVQVLGKDAATVFNSMTDSQKLSNDYDLQRYAIAFGNVRNLFGRSMTAENASKVEAAALASSIRNGLTDAQVLQALSMGRQQAAEGNVNTGERPKSMRGTGKVSLDGGVVDGVTYKGVKNKAAVKRSKHYRAVKAIAKALGVDVVLFESDAVNKEGKLEGTQGVYKDGVIYLDWNAGMMNINEVGDRMLLTTMAHELTHFIQKNASEEDYEALKDYVTKYLSEKMGEDFNDLVQQKMASRDVDYDGALDEVVADACETMLRDSEYVQRMIQENQSLWQTIKNFVLDFLKKITASDEGAQLMQDGIDELRRLWDIGLQSAVESRPTEIGGQDLANLTEAKGTDGKSIFQVRAFEHDEPYYRDMLQKWGGMSKTEVDDLFKIVDRAMITIKGNLEALDYAWEADIDDRGFAPVKPNSDKLYKVSQDFSTLCRKRILQGLVVGHLQTALNRALTREEGIAIRDALISLQKEGKQIEVACALCYVESARMRSPAQIQKFLDNREAVIKDFFAGKDSGTTKQRQTAAEAAERQAIYNEMGLVKGKGADNTMYDPRDAKTASLKKLPGNLAQRIREAKKAAKAAYTPTAEQQRMIETANSMTVADFTTPEGLENLAKNHRELFDAYTSFIRNATNSKGIENDTWWRAGDSGRISDLLIEQMNRENGLRTQSWSDFQVKHLMDYIAATIELATRGAKQHAYTKVIDYVDLMGNTGVMINMSLIPTRDYTGTLTYDDVEGFVYKEAMRLRDKYHATAGTICIGVKNEQIEQLMASDKIDYIIPYHHSGMAAHTRKAMHIPLWDDYQDFQNEKQLTGDAARANAEKYGVELLSTDDANWHVAPKFSDWFDLKTAKQIAELNGRSGKYGVMTGGYMAMQEAANRYKQLCAERGLAPKFSYGRGDFAGAENYWKLLIDRKMVDNVTGEIIEQKALKPVFEMDTIQRILDDELARYGTVKADQDEAIRRVSEAFLGGKIKGGMNSAQIEQAMQKPVDNISNVSITQSAAEVADRMKEAEENAVQEDFDNNGQALKDKAQLSRRVTNRDTLKFLNDQVKNGEVIHTYKTFLEVTENGKTLLLPPMAAKQRGDDGKLHWANAMALNEWEESVGNPNSKGIISKVNSKGETKWYYRLVKDNGKTVDAAYDPYQHSSDVVLNDQFEEAYQRPNLVTYECVIPKSELTSGYHYRQARADGQVVEAALPVGKHPWKKGTVAGKLKNTDRGVYLTRWLMPVRRVSNSEVAQMYKEILDREDTEVAIPFNVVPPGLLTELEKAGIKIDRNGSPGYQYRANKKAASEGDRAQLATRKDSFVKDKYYDKQIDKWNSKPDGAIIKVGVLNTGSALNKVGFPATGMWFDVGKIRKGFDNHSDHYSETILRDIPELLNNPIAITEFRGEDGDINNTVNVFGLMLPDGKTPVLVGVMMTKARNGITLINKIRTVHAHSNLDITDDNILYLNEDKKRTQNWFQVCGQSLPLEGAQFGLIRSIPYVDEESNTDFDISEMDQKYMDAVKRGDMETAQRLVDQYAKAQMPRSKRTGEENTIYINDGHRNGRRVDFVNAILNGVKKGETRTHKSLQRGWVGIAKDGMVYGRVKLGEPIVLRRGTQEYRDSLIKGTEFDIQEGETKYYYPILDVMDMRDNPRPITRNGNYGQYQFKSNEAVTYDDDGNVIPLSQRFNLANSDYRYSVRSDNKTDRELLKDAYKKMLAMKQRAIENLKAEQREALEQFHKDVERYEAKEREVTQSLDELDKAVQGDDPKAVQAARAKVTQKEEQLANALDNLTKSMNGTEIQQILRQERQIARQRARENVKETVNRGGAKKRVTQAANDLYTMLATNSDKLHVPEILKEPLGEFLEGLDFSSKRALSGGEQTKADQKFASRLQQLRSILENQQRYITGDGSVQQDLGAYLDMSEDSMEFLRNTGDMITEAMSMAGSFTINQMNSEQLNELAKFLKNLKSAIRNMNSFMANERYASVQEAADSDIDSMEELGKASTLAENKVLNEYLWKNGTPYYIFKRFGQGGESIFNGFAKGWAQMAFDAKKIIAFTEGAYKDSEVKKWRSETHDFTLEDGSKIKLTTAQIMELRMLLDREQALKHIQAGGIRIGNVETKGGARVDTKHYHLKENDIKAITDTLDAHQFAVAKKMQRFMAEQGAEWGNEISMKRFGYRFYTEGPGYYPIRTDANDRPMADTDAQKNSMFRLLNLSSSKSLNPKASNALIVGDIFDTFTDHMADMAKLHGMGLPILDAIKWFNFKERIDKEDGTYDTRTLQGAMEQAFGSPAQSYFRTLMKDINGQTENGDRGTGLANMAIGAYKAQAVAANLRVALLQPTAYLRAATVLKPKYMIGAFGNVKASVFAAKMADAAYKEAMQYSGEMVWKDIGGYDTDLSRSMRSQIQRGQSLREKMLDKSMVLAEWGDRLTWGRLWAACKMQTKAENKGLIGEALMQKTAELFREVIYSSQVMDSTLTRSELMRGRTNTSKVLTAFMAEPTLSVNILMNAASQYSQDARRLGKKEAFAKNAGKIAKAAAIWICTQTAAALVESLADAFRDDDDDDFWEKYLEAMFGEDNAKRMLGMEMGKNPKGWLASAYSGNLLQDYLLLNKLPVIKEAASLLTGFKSRNMLTEGAENVLNVYNIWRETADLANGVLDKPTSTTYYGKMTTFGKIYKTLQAMSQVSGTPLYSGTRDVVAIWNTIMNGNRDDLKIRTYDPNALSQSKLNKYKEVVEPTGMSQKEFQRLSKEIDTDGNGSVSQKEAGPYLLSQEAAGMITHEQAAAVWSATTTGKATYDEWLDKNK